MNLSFHDYSGAAEQVQLIQQPPDQYFHQITNPVIVHVNVRYMHESNMDMCIVNIILFMHTHRNVSAFP